MSDARTLKITNVETIRDMIHGFALPDHNMNIALPPGYTKTIAFEAGKPGSKEAVAAKEGEAAGAGAIVQRPGFLSRKTATTLGEIGGLFDDAAPVLDEPGPTSSIDSPWK